MKKILSTLALYAYLVNTAWRAYEDAGLQR